ncbi:hypothetical protein QYM36_002777 [Artemia franciscana]|uniref:Uncharacterized protein n=1 Tax=Artemia franciscana TaxID=6661 RepID=A0AA88L9R2_ARTSF|nr:hypothetical protein QYM36_002777 [Artemia franciscana]
MVSFFFAGLFVVPGDALKSEASTDEDLSIDEGKIPSFCVLLHAYLKSCFLLVENMAAFCQVADDRFGVIFSRADNKKKSNLMLGLLEPGSKSVPRYVDMNLLGPLSDLPSLENPSFPVRPSEKRSYATNVVTWSRPGSLQADVQKVVRHARKLPEKRHNFYKEQNKLRKAA